MNRLSGFGRPMIEDEAHGRRRKRRNAIIVAILVVIVAVGAAAYFMRNGAPAEQDNTAARGPAVTVMVPGLSDVARTITSSGTLAARRDQPVGVSGQGGRVTRVYVEPGDWVSQGQLLATIERSVQSQLAAQQRFHDDHSHTQRGGIFQPLRSRLVVFVHVIVLDLAEGPFIIGIYNFLERVQVIVEGEPDMADSAVCNDSGSGTIAAIQKEAFRQV